MSGLWCLGIVDFLFRIGSIYWSMEGASDRLDVGPAKPAAHLIYTHPNGRKRRSLQWDIFHM